MWGCEENSAVQCSIEHRKEERKAESRTAHKRSSLTGNGLHLRLHAHYSLQDERKREWGRIEGRETEMERE